VSAVLIEGEEKNASDGVAFQCGEIAVDAPPLSSPHDSSSDPSFELEPTLFLYVLSGSANFRSAYV
jgi:hypothetical protein